MPGVLFITAMEISLPYLSIINLMGKLRAQGSKKPVDISMMEELMTTWIWPELLETWNTKRIKICTLMNRSSLLILILSAKRFLKVINSLFWAVMELGRCSLLRRFVNMLRLIWLMKKKIFRLLLRLCWIRWLLLILLMVLVVIICLCVLLDSKRYHLSSDK